MSEQTVYQIDYDYIRRVVYDAANQVNQNVIRVDNKVEDTRRELAQLQQEVETMRREQRFAAALQRALTEIIRVRQELEEKFGTHKLVRENMLGILEASDLSLIRESTISRCTEELMLSAPKYWLAPCLIALAAWISNNESLAKRAVAEAVKRDDEKTSLLFALVCRRAQRTDTCFEWLARYFAMQNPKKMRKSIIAYIDAYSNGVFGEDKDNVCDEHINHWMNLLKKNNPNFTQEQEAYWEDYFARITATNPAPSDDYKTLMSLTPEAGRINAYVSRIDAVDRQYGIKASFNEILIAEVDHEELVVAIDKQLRLLVEGYEEEEEGLREQERFFTVVKETKGDEDRANMLIAAEKRRKYDPPVDFAKRLSDSITAKGEREDMQALSAKKTAVKLLKGYIQPAYERFVTEKKDAYPEEINLKLQENGVQAGKVTGSSFTWTGKTKNAENREDLVKSLAAQYDATKGSALALVTNKGVIVSGVFAAICFVFCLIMAIVGSVVEGAGICWFFAVISFIGTLLLVFLGVVNGLKKNKKTKETLNNYYDTAKGAKVKMLNKALNARVATNKKVADFEANKNSTKLFEEDYVADDEPEVVEEAPAAEEVAAPEVAEEAKTETEDKE